MRTSVDRGKQGGTFQLAFTCCENSILELAGRLLSQSDAFFVAQHATSQPGLGPFSFSRLRIVRRRSTGRRTSFLSSQLCWNLAASSQLPAQFSKGITSNAENI